MARSFQKNSKTANYSRAQRYRFAKQGGAKKVDAKIATVNKVVGGAKNGGSRDIALKRSTYYPVDQLAAPLKAYKAAEKPTKLKKSITPGTVLIVLAGRFRGKRVVFIKQLASGLLLVSGPFKVNGVPLRRINQAYVIATSAPAVDISGLDLKAAYMRDSFYKKPKNKTAAKSEEEFFEADKKTTEVDEKRKEAQKTVDAVLLKSVAAIPNMKKYLNARFSLTSGQFPHLMKF